MFQSPFLYIFALSSKERKPALSFKAADNNIRHHATAGNPANG